MQKGRGVQGWEASGTEYSFRQIRKGTWKLILILRQEQTWNVDLFKCGWGERDMLLWKACIFYCLWTLILWKCSKFWREWYEKLWLKELHLKIFMCTLLLSTLQRCINNSWYLFVILQWPFRIKSIYHVLRSWVLCADFFNASKILFYRLTYTVCQVFKGLFANKYEEKY